MSFRRSGLAVGLVLSVAGCEPTSPAAAPAASVGESKATSAPAAVEPRLIVPAAAKTPLADPPRLLSQEQLKDGWIALFDGRTLFGWAANSAAEWKVENGEIVSPGGPPGLLLTTTRFRDYEMRFDAKLATGGNSGVFLRTVPHPKGPADRCLEFNLCDSHELFRTGSLVTRAKAERETKVEGDWHAFRLVVQGDRVTAEIDGRQVLDSASPDYAATGGGHVGLQQNGGDVRFRNVFLKPLGLEAMGDGASLAGWRPVPGSKAEFGAEEGTIRVKGGTGFLESEETYADFVLQFEAKLNAKDVNSGLFFRAERGTEAAPSNGYELQLQNTVADGDRTRPADYGEGFGTGAIFRRQQARYVNATDEEWFAVTLVADGNRFASWVNGLQVTDFIDDRKPDKNPRQGRRDEAGHVSFQGHDPKTDASFRDLRIKPLVFGGP